MSMHELFLELQDISTKLYELTVQDVAKPLRKSRRAGPSKPKPKASPELKLDITTPDSLVDELVQTGAPRPTAQELTVIHAGLVSKLAAHHERTYREACSNVLNSSEDDEFGDCNKIFTHLQQANRRIFYQRSKKWERDLVDTCRSFYESEGQSSPALDAPTTKSSVFNMDFIPILEKVFMRTRFPSSTVKKVLAEKSGMSVKQIKDWFQNHRNRSKDATDSPFRDSDAKPQKDGVPFYAYPTRYPPTISQDNDPFPCRFGDLSIFSNIPWPRRSSSCSINRNDVDINTLTEKFEKMRIGKKFSLKKIVGVSKQSKSRTQRKAGNIFLSPYSIPPGRAPLMSAIKNAASSLRRKSMGLTSRKTIKKSGFARVLKRVLHTPSSVSDVTSQQIDKQTVDNLGPSAAENRRFSPTPSLISDDTRSSETPPPSITLSPSMPHLFNDIQSISETDSVSSNYISCASDASFDYMFSNSFADIPPYPLNINSAFDIMPALPNFSDSIDLISLDLFPRMDFQEPLLTSLC